MKKEVKLGIFGFIESLIAILLVGQSSTYSLGIFALAPQSIQNLYGLLAVVLGFLGGWHLSKAGFPNI